MPLASVASATSDMNLWSRSGQVVVLIGNAATCHAFYSEKVFRDPRDDAVDGEGEKVR